MPRIFIAQLIPQSAHLAGSAIGDAHARQVATQLASVSGDRLAIFDFAGIESASASYLKRLLNPFLTSEEANEEVTAAFSPIIVNAQTADLVEELDDYLVGKERALIVADDNAVGPRFMRLLGRLDGAAAETFHELRRLKEVTAQQLFELHPERTTNQTAWNNRLAQLVSMRLAIRRREGRFWIYQPTVTT